MKREKNQREKLWDEATGHCIYCGRPVQLEEMEVDHIQPLCQGGDNSFGNKVCACPGCNATKAGMSLEEFLREHMGKTQRKRLSNRVQHLAAQGKMNWSKAETLDPYSTGAFDGDWDECDDWPDDDDFFPEDACIKGIHFSGELSIEFW